MIYTVTLNPSIDYIAELTQFGLGKLNRTAKETFYPGGKGINVSIVLHNLGIQSTALGFVAGFTGAQIEDKLHEMQIVTDFIHLDNGISRINVKVKAEQETEINGMGPDISDKDIKQLLDKLCKLNTNDILVLAGSVPESLSDSIYEEICKKVNEKRIRTVVDTSGPLLMNVLAYHPYLVKPNHHELGQLFHVTIHNKEDAILYAKKLQELGARNVIVSMAEKGAIFLQEDGSEYVQKAPIGEVKNSVGAGDSVVAGFLAAESLGAERDAARDLSYAFRYGVCAGSASAFSEGMADKQKIDTLMEDIDMF